MATPGPETESLPEGVETSRLPSGRTPADYAVGESVVVFAPVTSVQRSLKRGTIEAIDSRSGRVRVQLDSPPPKIFRGTTYAEGQGTYCVSVRQPILMKERDYERLHGDSAAAAEWVRDGYMDSDRQRQTLFRQLTRVGITETIVGPPRGDGPE